MSEDRDEKLGFAPDWDAPVPYMLRTREYYRAIGYTTPYRWAHYIDAPFTALTKPLAECTLAIVTTAAPFDPAKGEQGPGAPYNSAAKFYATYSGASDARHDLRISHIGYDRNHTKADDMRAWFPLEALHAAAAAGRIGRVAPRFHGAPTNRSHRVTMETDGPEILRRCREDGVDAVLLYPNCPVCHQTVSLVARHLEANGIPTVVSGCAKDIVEHAGVARFLFNDFPLGNAAGLPHDPAAQATTLELALRLLETAPGPRSTLQSPLRWPGPADWKLDYSNVERLSPERLAELRTEFDRQKAIAKGVLAASREAAE
jgi:hypothetical protein